MFLVDMGMGLGGVMLTFLLTCTLSGRYVHHVAWVGYGDGWGDVKICVNLHAFCTTSITLLGFVTGMCVG